MKLDYVYGYRTKDTRNNVRYLDDKTIIYNAGKLCIIQNLENNTQRYFSGHRENVQCFTLNKERDLIASADGSNESMKSQIIVWDPNTFEVKIPIELDINGINCLHFSPNSSKLIAAGLDKDHSLLLINLSDGEILANTLCGKHKIVSCVFNNENEFATVGIKHCKFWTIQNEKELQFIDGEIDENVDKKLGVIEYCKNSYITGSSTGQIVIWQNGKSQNKKKIHDLPVDTLFTNEKYIISGGRDLCIIIMDYDLSELKKINLESLESSVIPNPRSIDVLDNVENKMLIGTISGEIMEFTFDKDIIDKDYNVELFNYSHFSTHSQENNEIISILYWKSKNLFISISEDCTIRIWNINENKQEKFIKLEEVKVDKSSNISEKKPKSADLSPNEEELIIGFSNGNIKKYSTNNFNETHKMSFNNNPISSIKYSPDGSLIALGTKDNDSNAFVLEIIKNSSNSLLYTIKGQNDSITKIDWSYDNQYIACVSQNNEVQIYSSKKGVLITKIDVVKNEEWKTWTRTFGWALNGYYEKGNSKITSCERYNKKMKNNKIIAIGNEKGEVRIYKYPVLSEEQEYCNGDYNHGDIVSNVKFALTNSDENGILFTSGNDGCIYKWILE
jgi:microtubule-associated protein-like 6